MPRPPIGEKAMTPAERQRRHRDIVTLKPMSKTEMENLGKLIRHREAMMTAAARQRSKELLAEFEQQMASEYKYDEDDTWKALTVAADGVAQEAANKIAARCAELGIPDRFAPTVELVWRGRGENAFKERRAELRRVAETRIEALESDALTQIKMFCHDAHARVLAHGLTSASAIDFFDSLPNAAAMMPALAMPAIEQILQARKADNEYRYYQLDRN
jgi:hypothetical protein